MIIEDLTGSKYLYFVLKTKSYHGKTPLCKYIDIYIKAAERGSAASAIVVLLHQFYVEQEINIGFFEKFLRDPADSNLAVKILRDKFNKFTN